MIKRLTLIKLPVRTLFFITVNKNTKRARLGFKVAVVLNKTKSHKYYEKINFYTFYLSVTF